MVRLIGPGLSSGASGTLANTLTFGKTGNTHTLRKKPTPKQPRSGLQVSMRAMMQFLSQNWTLTSPARKATWADAYADPQLSNYNAYIRHNLERWRAHRPPSQLYPAAETAPPGLYPEIYATAHVRHAKLLYYLDGAPNDNWVLMLFYQPTAPCPVTVDKLLHVHLVEDQSDNRYRHSPLPLGWASYATVPASYDGKVNWDDVARDSCEIIS